MQLHLVECLSSSVLLASQLVYIGLRDLDEGEKRIIQKLGIKAYTMQHVDRYGIGYVGCSC